MESTLPPIRQSPVSVVIPATASVLFDRDVAPWLPFVEMAPAGSQLIVIADSDVGNLPQHPQLRIVRHTQPLGLGACVQTAIWSVETPLVMFAPCDGSLSTKHAAAFFDRIDEDHIVAACRNAGPIPAALRIFDLAKSVVSRILLGYVPEPRAAWPGWSGWRRRCIARHAFGVPLLDPESGVLLARSEIFRCIPIQSRGPFAWVELLAKANHLGCLIDEIAIAGPPRPSVDFGRDALRVFRFPEFRAAPSSPAAAQQPGC